MIIETKFDVGDKVYILNKTFKYDKTTCTVCSGNKTIETTNGLTLECPECHGNGYKQISKPIYAAWNEQAIIKHLTYQTWEYNNNQVQYDIDITDLIKYEHKLFKTKQEAQLECDKFNKEQVTC
jgi:hypothetical protein